jgi:hypothetical protein
MALQMAARMGTELERFHHAIEVGETNTMCGINTVGGRQWKTWALQRQSEVTCSRCKVRLENRP